MPTICHLVTGPDTVKGYVSNILSKLQLGDRTQAAVYAWQKGLVQREEQLHGLLARRVIPGEPANNG